MDAVLQEQRFHDFGVDPFYPYARTGLCRIDGANADDLRTQVRRYLPRIPGVYGMLDPLGRLIYVGKSKALRNRLLSYFLPNNEEDKAGRIVQSTNAIVWESQPNEFAALLREQNLIRTFQPRFNVQGIPRRQQPVFICLGRQPAEQLYTARRHDPKAIISLGPLTGASRANRAVEVLNRVFQLRDCSTKQKCSFTEQLQLFDIGIRPGCIRLELQSCLGPCIAACSRGQYDEQVTLAKSFLQGKDNTAIEHLTRQMQDAASNLHYERAAIIREDLRCVEWLHRKASDINSAKESYTFVYPISGDTGVNHSSARRTIWYLIRHGIVEGAIPEPQGRKSLDRTNNLLATWVRDDNRLGSRFAPRPETLALVTGWFRKNRAELKRTFIPNLRESSKAGRKRQIAVKV